MPPTNPARAVVTTVAGSGAPGFRDGPALQAEFMLPAALAMDADGNVYIADAAAQRIRVLGRNGIVRTLAGSGDAIDHGLWVPGGYRDGPGMQAQFNVPSGIAVGPDRMIYVADTYNGRIRRVARDGTVSTFAVLGLPSALAFDRAGNLYVADRRLGVVRVSPSGTVTTLSMKVSSPFGIAICDKPPQPVVIWASDPTGLVYSVGGAEGTRLLSVSESGDPIGTPYQLATLDCVTALFTDVRTNTVHYFRANWSALLGGDSRQNSYDGGGFLDGPSTKSLFDAPLGIIAPADGGAFLVADGGNRRLRRISGFDRREVIDLWQAMPSLPTTAPSPSAAPQSPPRATPVDHAVPARTPAAVRFASLPAAASSRVEAPRIRVAQTVSSPAVPLPPPREHSGDFRVLYVGNSVIWWDTDWSDSIAGVVEREVNRALPPHGAHVRIVPVRFLGASVTAMASYLEEIADSGLVDAVVLHLNDGAAGEGAEQTWAPPAAAALGRTTRALRSAHVPFVIVVNPIPLELGPDENTWGKIVGNSLTPQYLDREQGWRTVLASTGAPTVDLWPAFFAESRSRVHRPIFSTYDAHLTAHGREIVGRAVAAELLRLHPWSASSVR